MIQPVDGPVSSTFQQAVARTATRPGVSFAVKRGTPVLAPIDGYIWFVDVSFAVGLHIEMADHSSMQAHTLMHLESVTVKRGDHVTAGDIIGYSGATGMCTGPCLTWAVKDGARYVDPLGPRDDA